MSKTPLKSSEPAFRATYRLQLRKEFPFSAAAKVIPYLDELGISHLYLSPILESVAGSNHGYDGIDPTKISAERGGAEGLEKLVAKLRTRRGLQGMILDLVPNHLAADWHNPAWWDVLKQGPDSPFWKFFDVKPRGSHNDLRIVLPVLGKTRQAALAGRELEIGLHNNELVFRYFDRCFPVAHKTYPEILRALAEVGGRKKSGKFWLNEFLEKNSGNQKVRANLPAAFNKWVAKHSAEAKELTSIFKGLPVKITEEALNSQNFVLKDWRGGNLEINYRRFFDINDLAGLRVEDPAVLKWSHQKIWDLMKKYKEIHGLRIDHIDGLTAPSEYLRRLRQKAKYVWVEKILGEKEKLNERWPVTGSTGYEFSNTSARIFVSLPGLMHLHSHYINDVDNRWERFHECVYDSKREMLESHFVSELNYIVEQFYKNASQGKRKITFTREDLHEALTELTSSLRVYRTYAVQGKKIESPWLEDALAETEGRGRLTSKKAFEWLRGVLLGPGDWSDDLYWNIKRWEQLTGPVMAKGLEDTAIYRYCPLISLNVVGGEPDWSGDGSIEFHAFNAERLRTHPLSMSTTSTHDTKRSEDVRSRIHAISEFSQEWTGLFDFWLKSAPKGSEGVRPSSQYLIYETIIGSLPYDGKITDDFIARLKQYFMKAGREAKTDTHWAEPNQAFEEAVNNLVVNVLRPQNPQGRALFRSLSAFAEKCMYFGAFNSLSLLTLKAMSPGLPDFYQGCDMWDLSLVDPDNRRAVDYDLRLRLLKNMKEKLKSSPQVYRKGLLSRWKTGEVKLWLTWKLLQLRKQDIQLFNEGEYLAVEPHGQGRAHFVSFLRHFENRWVLVVVPRFLGQREKMKEALVIRDSVILETEFTMPPGAPKKWTSVLNEETLTGSSFRAGQLLGGLPVAIFTGQN